MAATPDATIKANINTKVRVAGLVTRFNHASVEDMLVDSKVSRLERPIMPQGLWDFSSDIVPNNGDITVLANYQWEGGNSTSVALLAPDGNVVLPWATCRALVDNPGGDLTDRTKWKLSYGI